MTESESNTRDQIVTATRKLIENRGIAHITTKQIARTAGCAEGTIFRHFEHKEDLLLAAVLANFPSFKESLMSITGGSSLERLRRLGLNVIRFFEQITPASVAVLSDAELTRRHREIVRERNGGPQRLYLAVTRWIESEQAHGALNPNLSSVHIASMILGPCFFRVFTRLSLGKDVLEVTDEEFVAGVVESLWEGLRPVNSKPRGPTTTDKAARMLAVIRKRSFLDIGRERLAGLVQLEADTVGYGSELLLG
jgi:AcrR family transcriptional regulator